MLSSEYRPVERHDQPTVCLELAKVRANCFLDFGEFSVHHIIKLRLELLPEYQELRIVTVLHPVAFVITEKLISANDVLKGRRVLILKPP